MTSRRSSTAEALRAAAALPVLATEREAAANDLQAAVEHLVVAFARFNEATAGLRAAAGRELKPVDVLLSTMMSRAGLQQLLERKLEGGPVRLREFVADEHRKLIEDAS
jgi:hypothetical protein